MSKMPNRVVVTGLGAISALGHDLESQWAALLAGHSGVTAIDTFPASEFPCQVGALVRDLDPRQWVYDRKALRAMDKHSHMAFAATGQALRDAHLDTAALDKEAAAIMLGTGMIDYNISDLERAAQHSLDATRHLDMVIFGQAGIQEIYPLFPVELLNNATLCQIAMQYHIRGPNATFSPFGESGAQAIGEAYRLLRRGLVETAVAGGYSLQINPSALARFTLSGLLREESGENGGRDRLGDSTSYGMVLGEGAGIVVLETLEHALARQAPIHAELVGYGWATGPSQEDYPVQATIAQSLHRALESAHVDASDLDYIHADAPGLRTGDAAEAAACAEVLDTAVSRVLLNSTKGATGHLLAGAAPYELVTTILALETNMVPPTTFFSNPDPTGALNFVRGAPREQVISTAACLAAGFWGQSVSLIVRRFQA
jgi:3-oxoacyl-[acyl-carrier-protein] synthase II